MFTLPTTITTEKPLLLEELNSLPADAAAQLAYSIMTGKGRSRVTAAAETNLLGPLSTGKSMMLAITSQTAAA